MKIYERKSDGWTAPIEIGKYVSLEDYQSLQSVLCEALEDWEGWMPTKRSSSTIAERGRARIAALRAQFIDDQPSKEPSC